MSSKTRARKKNEKILLLPGAGGWETWKGVNGGGLALATRTSEHRALEVDGIPSGELVMAFPVRDVSSLPFRAPTTDEALFGDMGEMHIERLGMHPRADAGVLSDVFAVGLRGDESVLQPVVLAPPPVGALPKRSPRVFDISARCLPLPDRAVVLWRELGRWVFAVAEGAKPVHFQALASSKLGREAGREIQLSLAQLRIQGVIEDLPSECLVWIGDEEPAPEPEDVETLAAGFGGRAGVAAKPAPFLPENPSRLLPADVRAERAAKRQRQQTILLSSVAAVAYLGAIGWLVWTLMAQNRRNAEIQAEIDELEPMVAGIGDHYKKWQELQPVTEVEHWPVELMFNAANAIPKDGRLRLKRAEIVNQLKISEQGGKELQRSIRLQGEADELEQANMFNLNLKESDALREYVWITPPPNEDAKTGRWIFNYVASHDPVAAAAQ